MKQLTLYLLLILLLEGCQPYLDHEQLLFRESYELDVLGQRRQLKIIEVKAEERSLTLTFNQPLRRLENDVSDAPFRLELTPSEQPSRLQYAGLATVKVTFEDLLKPASKYNLRIFGGWDTPTGVRVANDIFYSFSTPRPALSEIRTESGRSFSKEGLASLASGEGLVLSFNQAISMASLRSSIICEPSAKDAKSGVATKELAWNIEGIPKARGSEAYNREFLFRPNLRAGDFQSYRFYLKPGLRSLTGSLVGEGSKAYRFCLEHPLVLSSPQSSFKFDHNRELRLIFSSPLDLVEARRSLVAVPSSVKVEASLDRADGNMLILKCSGSTPSTLLLLAGMKSADGFVLGQDVEIPICAGDEPVSIKNSDMPLVPLALEAKLGGGLAKIEVWPLTLEQALDVAVTSAKEWQNAGPLQWEKQSPLIFNDTIAAWAKARKKAKGAVFFAVRTTTAQGKVQRGLVGTNDLKIHAYSSLAGVQVKVSDSKDRPVSSCKIFLRALEPKSKLVPPATYTNASGEASLVWRVEKPESWAVVAKKGDSEAFVPLVLKPQADPSLAPFLVLDQQFYAPGQDIQASGFLAGGQEPSVLKGHAELIDSSGKAILNKAFTADRDGLFSLLLKAPQGLGVYRLKLEFKEQEISAEKVLQVCKKAKAGEVYSLALEGEGPAYQAVLERQGERYREIGLRAYWHPLGLLARESKGWTSIKDRVPSSIPINVLSTEVPDTYSLSFIPPKLPTGELVVEAFDSAEPGLILARSVKYIAAAEGSLGLSFRPGERSDLVKPVLNNPATDGISEAIIHLTYRPVNSADWLTIFEAKRAKKDDSYLKLSLMKPGVYRLSIEAETDQGQKYRGVWEKAISKKSLMTKESGYRLEPWEGKLGARIFCRAPLASVGQTVWLEARAEGRIGGQWQKIRSDGLAGSFLVPPSQAKRLEVIVDPEQAPGWGSQRLLDRQQSLSLPVDDDCRVGELQLSIDGLEGESVTIRDDQKLSLLVSSLDEKLKWTGFVGWTREYDGLPQSNLSLEESSNKFVPSDALQSSFSPLLDQNYIKAGPVVKLKEFSDATSLLLSAPQRLGNYRLWLIARDSLGRYAKKELAIKVISSSNLTIVKPWGIRPGDNFFAGIKVKAVEEQTGALGLNLMALAESSLPPKGYVETANVLSPGQSCLLGFSYGIGEDFKPAGALPNQDSGISLAWKFGYGGEIKSVFTGLEVLTAQRVAGNEREGQLGVGDSKRLPIKEKRLWRLALRPAQEAKESSLLKVNGPKGSLGEISLKPESEPIVMDISGPGTVSMENKLGAAVAYRLAPLELDRGESKGWSRGFFLQRTICGADDEPVKVLTTASSYGVLIDMVNPKPRSDIALAIPMPGGLQPVAVYRYEATKLPIFWSFKDGEVLVKIRHLAPGEHRWRIETTPLATGDYVWPAARGFDSSGRLEAVSESSRVIIRAKSS